MTTRQLPADRPLPESLGPAMPLVQTVVVDGETRYFAYVEPDPATPDPIPLVVALHGAGATWRSWRTPWTSTRRRRPVRT